MASCGSIPSLPTRKRGSEESHFVFLKAILQRECYKGRSNEPASDRCVDFGEPVDARLFVAQNNLFEITSLKRLRADDAEDDRLPKVFQRVAVDF